MSGRRLSSQNRYVIDVDVVSVPAILDSVTVFREEVVRESRNVHVTDAFRNDVVIRHLFTRRVPVIHEPL